MATPMPSGVILTFLMFCASSAKIPVQTWVAHPVFTCFDTFLERRDWVESIQGCHYISKFKRSSTFKMHSCTEGFCCYHMWVTDHIAYLLNKSSDGYFYFNPIIMLESGTSSKTVSFEICYIQSLLNLF